LMNLYFNAYKFLDDLVEVDRLKAAGYDGAIHIGNGETAGVLEYRVFDLRQVRPAFHTQHSPGYRNGGHSTCHMMLTFENLVPMKLQVMLIGIKGFVLR